MTVPNPKNSTYLVITYVPNPISHDQADFQVAISKKSL